MKRFRFDNTFFLKLLFLVRYFACGLFLSFFSLLLLDRGLNESEMGLVFSVQTISYLAVHMLFLFICKNANDERKALKFTIVLEGLCVILFIFIRNYILIAIAAGLYTAGRMTESLIDGYTQTYCLEIEDRYASFRLLGSFGYLLGSLVTGYIIEYCGYTVMMITCGSIYLASSLLTFLTRPVSESFIEAKKQEHNVKEIIKNKAFWFYMLLSILLVQFAGAIFNYMSILLKTSYQIKDSVFGILTAIVTGIECVCIFIGRKIVSKKNAMYFLLFGAFFAIVKYLIISFNPPLWLAITAYLLNGIANGVIIGFSIEALAGILGKKNVAFGALLSSVIVGLVKAVLDYVSGLLFHNIDYFVLYRYASIILLGIFVIFTFVTIVLGKKKVLNFVCE